MRTRLLGTIAAVAAGGGGVLAQGPTPPPPAPIGTVGSPTGGVMPVSGASDPIAPPIGMMGGPGPMGHDPMGGMMGHPGMGGPMYPPPGAYGAQPWEKVNDPGVHGRIAPRAWTDVDFLLWFVPSQTVRGPLLTSGPPASLGVLGAIGTTVQAGQQNLGYGVFTGFNIHTGWFWDDCRRYGTEIGGFMTETRTNSTTLASDSTGQPLIARPFINAANGQQAALLVSFPTYASGSATVYSNSKSYGAEVSAVTNLFRSSPDDCGSCRWLNDANLYAGFRYLSMEEELRISSSSNILAGNTAPFDGKTYNGPVTIEVEDRYRTANRFYGGQIGLKSAIYCGAWTVKSRLSAAVGLMHQEVTVDGFSTLTNAAAGTRSVVPGGLYANSMNIGKYTNDEFGFIPEVGLSLGRQWTSWFSTHVGYNFLYINRVARPGDQYVTNVNPAVIPTNFGYGVGGVVPVPNPIISQSDYFLQGVSLGFTVRY